MADKVPDWAYDAARAVNAEIVNDAGDDIQIIAAALLSAYRRAESDMEALLRDPAAVRVNYLRGGIACQPLIDDAYRRGVQDSAKVADEAELVDSTLWSPGSEMHAYHDGQEYAMRTIAAAIRRLGEAE